MKPILLILVALNFLSYFWSVIGIFKKVEFKQNFKYRLVQLNSLLLWIICVNQISHINSISIFNISALCSIQIFCLVAFWMHTKIVKENEFSIVFSYDIPKRLVQKGFYKKIRHPFYLIYMSCYYSIAVLIREPLIFILSFTISVLYIIAAKDEEKKFLNSPFSSEYEQYKKYTGMFFPKIFTKDKSSSPIDLI